MVFALSFALFFAVLPDDTVSNTGPKIVLFVVAAMLGPITVLILRFLADRLALDRRRFVVIASAGAVTFDGLFVGLWPDVYGHEGAALANVAALILFGLAAILVADQAVPVNSLPRRQGNDQ
ncbi:MAG: hypothetical protein ACKOCE_03355 [Acidimicrobiia bacterium]